MVHMAHDLAVKMQIAEAQLGALISREILLFPKDSYLGASRLFFL